MDTPFFTVVIPTYNRANLLAPTIRSVLDQTFWNFELIIVDDYSTDNTAEIVESFRDERIEFILNDRTKGASGARNAGIFRANGAWVAFLDSDDLWLPEKLDMLYKKTQEVDHDTGLIYTGWATYDFDAKREIVLKNPEKEGWLQDALYYDNIIGTFSTVAIRNSLLQQLGGCDEGLSFYEDGDLYVRIAGLAKIACIRKKLTYYRQSNKDKLSLQYGSRLRSYQQFREKHKDVINKNYRLRHRLASEIWIHSIHQKNWDVFFHELLWTLMGLFIDIPNIFYVLRNVFGMIKRNLANER